MILRIGRFSVAADQEDNVVAALRRQAATRERPLGLEDLVFAVGRPVPDRVEFVTVTLWTDMEAVKRALGPSWNAPGGVADIADLIEGKRVEHLDVFADDWPELVGFLDMPLAKRHEVEMTPLPGSAAMHLEDEAPLSAIV
jgi:hypothetical protein